MRSITTHTHTKCLVAFVSRSHRWLAWVWTVRTNKCVAAETFWLAKFETIIIKTHKFWSFLILYHASKFSQNYKLSNANFMLIIRPLNELISRDWFFSTRNALFCWLLPAPALLHHSLSLFTEHSIRLMLCSISMFAYSFLSSSIVSLPKIVCNIFCRSFSEWVSSRPVQWFGWFLCDVS